MSGLSARALILFSWVMCVGLPCGAAEAPKGGTNSLPAIKDLHTPRQFPQIVSRQEWQARAEDIREQVLVSCGLWPMPERTPLQARVFGRIDRDGYSVEKVCFQSLPGFYVGGNLYRPRGRGKGPFPAILNPHGHWKEGRLADNKDGSVPARCISFARQGMIAFAYDMVGYNDTSFADYGAVAAEQFYLRHRRFATNQVNLLWNISLMGLQTWDSIRALDFLESLPDVDRRRLACTGASGGGTQTFMLGAVDDRLAAQAPVVMVSHTMQGGCSCENAPGLRVEYSNMELAAAAAPRPQMLVAATGDWTKDTLTVEGPALAHIYQLFNAGDKFRCARFDFGHNYNQTSREAVYEWFGKWLLKQPLAAWLKEAPYQKEPDDDLRVFPNGKLPEDAASEARVIQWLESFHLTRWEQLVPRNEAGLKEFKRVMQPAWRHTLQVEWPASHAGCQAAQVRQCGLFTAATLNISRLDGSTNILASYWAPPGFLTNAAPKVVVLCSDKADSAPTPQSNEAQPAALPLALLQRDLAVLVVDHFSTGNPPNQFTNFYATYNRTELQERVRDLLTVCGVAGSVADPRGPRFCSVVLWGTGRAGLWALLAAPAAGAVVADGARLDVRDDQALLAPDLFCPGIRNIGTFEAGAVLAAPHPLLLHNIGEDFPTEALRAAYRASGQKEKLRVVANSVPEQELVEWVSRLE
jgi:Acetyl xylan esterase (AXE1)